MEEEGNDEPRRSLRSEAYRDVRRARTSSTIAPQSATAPEEEGYREGHVLVSVRHIDLTAMQQSVNSHANNTKKQPQAHASGREQQGGEQHTHRRGKSDGEPTALRAGIHGVAENTTIAQGTTNAAIGARSSIVSVALQ